jgi:hypothetical protein
VAALGRRDAEAARWWHEKAPHVVATGKLLSFPAEVCERLGGVQALRLARMTTRRWMIVTAIVAIGLTSGLGWSRL